MRHPQFALQNEKPLQGQFLYEIFGTVFGYQQLGANSDGSYTLIPEAASTETKGGKTPDAQLGFFSLGGVGRTMAVVELKSPATDLDAQQKREGRRTPVEQGFGYVSKFDGCRWVVVSNFTTIRLYWTVRGEGYFWSCNVADLDNITVLSEALRVLHRDNLLGQLPDNPAPTAQLAQGSVNDERALTNAFYGFFKTARSQLFEAICAANPTSESVIRVEHETTLLRHTQTILDRLLFVCFAEDTGLLPHELLRQALDHAGQGFATSTRWDQLKGLFNAINVGVPAKQIHGYNGGLFASDQTLDSLTIADEHLEFVYEMASYDYSDQLGVEVLGRVFERSIVDIEALHAEIDPAGTPTVAVSARSKRSQEGVFYTPDWVTRFLAGETLSAWVDQRFDEMWSAAEVESVRGRNRRRDAEIQFWEAWQNELRSIKILDPACGSGAFLVAAFDALYNEYDRANRELGALRGGQAGLFDPDKDILESNLYGVDLNSESVEITRLSLWLKTAKRGRTLTSLANTIRHGNSLISPAHGSPWFDALPDSERALAFDWHAEFDEVFDLTTRPADRIGFDIVVGNPPYVRGEWLDPLHKNIYAQTFDVFTSKADLLVYFYERSLELLASQGRLGFIVSNKWLRAGYGEPLRRYLSESARVDQLIDFGHAPIFEDADTFPVMTLLSAPTNRLPTDGVRVAAVPRQELGAAGLSQMIDDREALVGRERFNAGEWSLEPPDEQDLVAFLAEHSKLSEAIGLEPLAGIKTGYNAAYVIDQRIRDLLVQQHPAALEVIVPLVSGRQVHRWGADPESYLIAIASSADRTWPWSGVDDPEQVFADTYPSIHRWFTTDHRANENRREGMVARGDQGIHWWELRKCAYMDAFSRPKLIYTDIAWQPEVALDTDGRLHTNNTAYFIPNGDTWTAALLNSPVVWWYAWRTFQHGKDEVLRWFTASVTELPYVSPIDAATGRAADEAVLELVERNRNQHREHQALLAWLRKEFNVVTPGRRLGDPALLLNVDDFLTEAKRVGRFEMTPLAQHRLAESARQHYEVTATHLAASASLERILADVVEASFGLSDDQRRLLRTTAPPRTPLYAADGIFGQASTDGTGSVSEQA